MTIQILPARLANQIAAGEVVERPASVVKELVENSLDAGATSITIDIEKGGAKRIKITDNGAGIAKDELTLALSRHATSKIKSLDDLEAISSLGFRGEALASISSVSRLTLTSNPELQEAAWQAATEGRDMHVIVQPAAHPNGTSIDVQDLFFNTPARRKFLRTEKTEFNHIEEVVRRIALSEFGVSFTLNHNGKRVKQFKACERREDYSKRIAAVCGNTFLDNAIAIDCRHHDIYLWGWIAKPHFYRNQNDLCYSYVNGRMMRDKLINHAIRQAFANLLPDNAYPAFVLYLELDHKEVDVNVHPAKHEVRFHQGRYVHDFIHSIIENAVCSESLLVKEQPIDEYKIEEASNSDYIAPLKMYESANSSYIGRSGDYNSATSSNSVRVAANNYQQLLSTSTQIKENLVENDHEIIKLFKVVENKAGVISFDNKLACLPLKKLSTKLLVRRLLAKFPLGLVSQPLLLPITISLESAYISFIQNNTAVFNQSGFQLAIQGSQCQIRQCPAQLRNKNIASVFEEFIESLIAKQKSRILSDNDWCESLALVSSPDVYDESSAQLLLNQAKNELSGDLNSLLHLICIDIDLTSVIKQALE